ncbi:flagellar basal body L-ring protein FlgH [Parvularcula sp. LCG005]|uniref:flagellar basal body L-ring protein FlgH n=1 Tax=Parvularcula sp. LCG005 TaxID=3078805 RepID=UPI0029426878|nr:flagellar basal body L-ring protein FlgH [Parvularcula sp. LCG005]WOI52688.1 flagellar basal body L-ring protein FlgH [Parvularcula sp. LCG005]
MKNILLITTLLPLCACASRMTPVSAPAPERIVSEQTYVPVYTASLWNQEPQSLFGNRRARNVGDILTVIVSVDEEAEMQNSLQRSRSNQEDFSVNALFGLPEYADGTLPEGATLSPAVALSRSNAANGNGSIARQEKITLRLAAQVVEKLPNGHLVVVGTQRIRVNNETRDLRLNGVVRPDDISRDNTITHDKVAAADIVYTGQGQIAQSTRPRRGSRLLDILIPF